MPRNMNWVMTASRKDRDDLKKYASDLLGFINEENMPEDLAAQLKDYSSDLETIAGDAEEKEKKKALDRLYGFSHFLYSYGGQINGFLKPERANDFRELVGSINKKLDLQTDLTYIFDRETREKGIINSDLSNAGQKEKKDDIQDDGILKIDQNGQDNGTLKIDQNEQDDGILKIDQEVARKNKGQPVKTGFGAFVFKKMSLETLIGAPDVLDKRQRAYMQTLDEMKKLSEMFGTKKNFRLFNWNSGVYNRAKRSLDSYIATITEVNTLYRDLLEKFGKKEYTEEMFTDVAKSLGERMDRAASTLRDDMKAYAVHATGGKNGQFGDLSIDGKTQATGAARLAGSMEILSLLDRANRAIGLQPEALSETRTNERVKETNFTRLYQQNFKDIAKESDRHRRAAFYAQETRRLGEGVIKADGDLKL